MLWVSVLILVAGIISTLLTVHFSLRKADKRSLVIILSSLVLIGIGLWLLSMDHTVYINNPVYASSSHFGSFYLCPKIPPPWYATLWFYFLGIGLGMLSVMVIFESIIRLLRNG
ncbi:hypothetical protein [Acidianus brierleyi]|uniref:hypothetical protein n=1 Tax=Acidianus brierleyi TaxID=41673 RepID=UPI001FE9AF44|nr:hypothetical protein [Acidianus brierleyi]